MNDNIQSAIDAGSALGHPNSATGATDYVVIPANYKLEPTEPHLARYLPAPRRCAAKVNLLTAESFIDYVLAFKSLASRIFIAASEANPPACRAVLDYHKSGTDPAWCEHVASYAPLFAPEWSRWMAKNRIVMNQLGLAEFLEENQLAVVTPPGAELLELVQTLEGKNDIRCNSSIRLSNGKTRVLYEEDVALKGTSSTQSGSVEFPTSLTVALPMFTGGPAYKIVCRLKYRIQNRKLDFWFEAVDVHLSVADAVNDLVELIKEKTGITPLLGSLAS